MKRSTFIAVLVVSVFASGWFARGFARPRYPSHWDGLQLGMTKSEADATVSGLDASLRSVKGFDQAGLDYGDRYWNLLVKYSDDGLVREIEKQYTDKRMGIFNGSFVESTP